MWRRGVVAPSGSEAEEAGAIDHAPGAGVEEAAAVFCRAEAAANLAGELRGDALDQRTVVALALGGVKIDELDEGIAGEAADPVVEVVKGKPGSFAVHKLHDPAAHEVDCGNQHGIYCRRRNHAGTEAVWAVMPAGRSAMCLAAGMHEPRLAEPRRSTVP